MGYVYVYLCVKNIFTSKSRKQLQFYDFCYPPKMVYLVPVLKELMNWSLTLTSTVEVKSDISYDLCSNSL